MSTRDFEGKEVVISYDATRCIHAGECVRGAPAVFDPEARPWIAPDRADGEQIAQVIRRCPTGALTLRFRDGRVAEMPDALATIALAVDGPLYLRGRISYQRANEATVVEYTRVALCRCGASGNKPFCDGSHRKLPFRDAGNLTAPAKPLPAATAPRDGVRLTPTENGPLLVEGRVEFRAADGSNLIAGEKCWLCRCGNSKTKPFCDGSHKAAGFVG